MSDALLTEIYLWALTAGLFVWGVFQAAAIWRDRPMVMYDDRLECWRAAPRYGYCQKNTPMHGIQPIRPIRSPYKVTSVTQR